MAWNLASSAALSFASFWAGSTGPAAALSAGGAVFSAVVAGAPAAVLAPKRDFYGELTSFLDSSTGGLRILVLAAG